MKVPDESLYDDFSSITKIEDIKGYRYCPHCDKCVITTQTQLHTDGAFYCFYRRKWKRANDLIEKDCQGFRIKSCYTCKNKRRCVNKDVSISFCNRYIKYDIAYKNAYMMGRTRITKDPDIYTIRTEEKYNEYKRKQRDRELEREIRSINDKTN